jgi:CopG family transcriptional regulator / antitoxin EndoAI
MDTQLINFTIPKELLLQVDKLAKKELRSRSDLLREAARHYLEQQQLKQLVFTQISKTAKRSNLTEEKAITLAETAKQWARAK